MDLIRHLSGILVRKISGKHCQPTRSHKLLSGKGLRLSNRFKKSSVPRFYISLTIQELSWDMRRATEALMYPVDPCSGLHGLWSASTLRTPPPSRQQTHFDFGMFPRLDFLLVDHPVDEKCETIPPIMNLVTQTNTTTQPRSLHHRGR